MCTNKIILITIVLSFVVFRQVQTNAADDSTLGQYLGEWYLLGIANHRIEDRYSCGWIKIINVGDNSGSYHGVYKIRINGTLYQLQSAGQFVNSELDHEVPFQGEHNTVSIVERYNDGSDLIIALEQHTIGHQFVLLVSRSSSTSNEMELAFRESVGSQGYHAARVVQYDCLYEIEFV